MERPAIGQPVAKVAQLSRGSRGIDGAPGIVPIVRDRRVPGLTPIFDVRMVTACQIFRWWTRKPLNAQRINGECGNGRLTLRLTRKPGQSTFVGELVRDASPAPSEVTLAP